MAVADSEKCGLPYLSVLCILLLFPAPEIINEIHRKRMHLRNVSGGISGAVDFCIHAQAGVFFVKVIERNAVIDPAEAFQFRPDFQGNARRQSLQVGIDGWQYFLVAGNGRVPEIGAAAHGANPCDVVTDCRPDKNGVIGTFIVLDPVTNKKPV